MNPRPDLLLASTSPRRADGLRRLGIAFTQVAGAVDETPLGDEEAHALVRRLARAKAEAGRRAALHSSALDLPVLGADTLVALAGRPLGKPRDAGEGMAMLLGLADRWHAVHTALAVVHDARAAVVVVTARVRMRPLTLAEAAAYWASGEPHDKAGGYALQGSAGRFVERIDGDPGAVVGLPARACEALLRGFGVGCGFPRAASEGGPP